MPLTNKPLKEIVIASSNKGKLSEFSRLFSPFNIDIIPQSKFNTPEADEIGLSFIENAIIKARNACQHSGQPAIADDSGLEVDALNKQPGIYSARYSQKEHGSNCNDKTNNQKLLTELNSITTEDRTARFICALVFMQHASDPTPIIALGQWEGSILFAEQGDNGFGYDPLFYVAEHDCSSAQLPSTIKNKISHRGLALQQLIEKLRISNIL